MPPAEIWQLGGMSAVALILLWANLSERKSNLKTLQSMSVTIVSLQKMLLVSQFQHVVNGESEEAKQAAASLDKLTEILVEQRQTLERVHSEK